MDGGERVEELLEELLQWQKFAHLSDVREILEELFSDADAERERDMKLAYQLTDGSNSSRDIAEHVSTSHVTVANWQRKWARMGLVNRQSERSPYEHIASLEELGLPVPDIQDTESAGDKND